MPAVEHFSSHKNAQIFLMVDFAVTSLGITSHIERCLACYPEEREEEKQEKVDMANDRLKLLYEDFERAAIIYEKSFFK